MTLLSPPMSAPSLALRRCVRCRPSRAPAFQAKPEAIRRPYATSTETQRDDGSDTSPMSTASSSRTEPRGPAASATGDASIPRSNARSASAQLAEARRLAHEQVQRLANTLNVSARKQAGSIAASIQALELERKLKEVGGKINHATGYEEIERLRNDVGEKGERRCFSLLMSQTAWLTGCILYRESAARSPRERDPTEAGVHRAGQDARRLAARSE